MEIPDASMKTNAELADEIERRRGGTDMLNSVLLPHYWQQIIAALRRQEINCPHMVNGECGICRSERLMREASSRRKRQPSSDKVLVPRTLLRQARDALSPFCFGGEYGDYNNDDVLDACGALDRAMLSAAEAEGHHE